MFSCCHLCKFLASPTCMNGYCLEILPFILNTIFALLHVCSSMLSRTVMSCHALPSSRHNFHVWLTKSVSTYRLTKQISDIFVPQNLISEARNSTDQALQLLQTISGVLNRSRQHVTTGENNYQVHTCTGF